MLHGTCGAAWNCQRKKTQTTKDTKEHEDVL
jgi:hypothetical protein